jgi:hypothetical protein
MDGWEVLTNIVNVVSRFPVERFLVRNPDKDLDQLEIRLKEKGLLKARSESLTQSSPGPSEASPSVTRLQQAPKTSRLTPEEILAYQNKKIGEVLYEVELHLAEGCRIFNKPCDCCEKHSLIRGLAVETIPIASRMGKSTEPYEDLVSWLDRNEPKFSEEAVASGRYDGEYKALSGEVSLLRKAITGSHSRLEHFAAMSPHKRTEILAATAESSFPERERTLARLGKHDIVQVHDDGDLTVRSHGKLYVITTEGKTFEQKES